MERISFLLNIPGTSVRKDLMRYPKRGFSLVELMVVISIMVILTVVVLTGQNSFNQSLLLNDTAYTLALSAREAQSLGLSSRKFSSIQNAGYGVAFSAATPDRYQIFADIYPGAPGNSYGGTCPGHTQSSGPEARPGDCMYDSASELVQEYTFTRGFKIGYFCGIYYGSKTCSTWGYWGLQSATAVFERPNSTSVLTGIYRGSLVPLTCIEVHLAAPTGDGERLVKISSSGQVAMGLTCP